MATEGYVKFEYFSKGVPPYYGTGGFPELIDDEKITIETPSIDMSYHQYVGLFKKFLMAVGFDQKNLIQAGCSLAFSEMNDEKLMREVAEEYELIMSEDLPKILEDSRKKDYEWIEKHNESWEQRYWALYNRFSKLAHLTDDDIEETATKYKERNDGMMPWGHSDLEYGIANPTLTENRNSNFPGENTYYTEDTSNEDMWDQGVMKVTTNIPDLAWNGLVPGSPEARAAGCICPVLDNEEMPDDKKWIDVACPIHGKKNKA